MRNRNAVQVWDLLRYGPKPINRTAQSVVKKLDKHNTSAQADKYWCKVCQKSFSTTFEKHRKSEEHKSNRMKKQGYGWIADAMHKKSTDEK